MKTIFLLFAQLLFVSSSFSEINAIYNNDNVEISWNNPKHIKVDYFVIERSKNGIKFKEILTIDATANNGSTIEYYEIDYAPFNKKAYYRIKQVDINGHNYYSEMVMAQNFDNAKSLFTLFSKKDKKLKDYNEKDILVVLYDSNKKQFVARVDLMMRKKQLTTTYTNEFLPTGEYIVIGTSDDRIYGKKISVEGSYTTPVYTQNKE